MRHARKNFPGTGVVIDHQHADAQQLIGGEHASRRSICLHVQTHAKVKRRTTSQHTFDPDAASHHLHQALGDRQSQAGPSVLASGGTIGLDERLKNSLALLFAHADARVAHPEMQLDLALVTPEALDAQHDFTLFGELRRVVAQVGQDLAQPQRVANQCGRQIGNRAVEQLQAFILGPQAYHIGEVLQHVFQAERNTLQVHPAGFDLGEIEDVVDDPQQVLRRTMHFHNVVALPVIEVGAQRQVAHADNGIHRRADFMAHVGEEFAFGPCRLFGDLPGVLY
ncbi:hypothetical protein D3C78_496490 [compost metagenome]